MPDSGQPASQGAGMGDEKDTHSPPLRHLRAAQLRARAVRGGLVKLAFGTIFLVGALAHALSPERHEQSSLIWITLLSLMSTINVALGLRSLARTRSTPRKGSWDGPLSPPRLRGRAWAAIAVAWGVLAVLLLGLLLRR